MELFNEYITGPLQVNSFVFGSVDDAALVDPGGQQSVDMVRKMIEDGVKIKYVLLTHGHFDHASHAKAVMELLPNAKLYAHAEEIKVLAEFMSWTRQFGLPPAEHIQPDQEVVDEEILVIGNTEVQILHVPGHSPGSVTYHIPGEKKAIVGDLIFKDSIGRVDFPHCDPSKMVHSLRRVMDFLPGDTVIYPGHGSSTTMSREIRENYYLSALDKGHSILGL